MKQIIILAAVLPLLMLFAAQFTVQQKNAAITHFVAETVDIAKEQAKRDGCFTDENIADLKRELAGKLALEEDEIIITASQTPKYRTNSYRQSEQIYYRIEVPIKKVMAGGKLLGISDEQNTGRIILENAVASELLMP